MNFGDAVAAMRSGQKVRRESWGDDLGYPSFLVLIPGREIEASYPPMVEHLGAGTKFKVNDHIDGIFCFDHPVHQTYCVVGYGDILLTEAVLAEDWQVVA